MVSPSLQIQYAAQVALQRCLILRIDKAYILYHFPCNLSIGLISNNIFCPTLGERFRGLHAESLNIMGIGIRLFLVYTEMKGQAHTDK